MKIAILLSCLVATGLAAPAANAEHEVASPRLRVRDSTMSCYQKVMKDLDVRKTQDSILYNAGQSCMANMNSTGLYVSCVTTTALSNGASTKNLGDFIRDLLRCGSNTSLNIGLNLGASGNAGTDNNGKRSTVTDLNKRQNASCVQTDGAVADLNSDDMQLAEAAISSCAASNSTDEALYECIRDYVNTNDKLVPGRQNGIISVAYQCSDQPSS